MTKFKPLLIDPTILAFLEKTADEVAAMTVGEFAQLSHKKGIVWKARSAGGRVEGLTIANDRDT